MLHSYFIKNSFETLHQKFIVTPIDKANGKFDVVKEVELRGNHASTPETYESCVDRTKKS